MHYELPLITDHFSQKDVLPHFADIHENTKNPQNFTSKQYVPKLMIYLALPDESWYKLIF